MVNQYAADHDNNMGSVINCINNSGRFVQSAVPEFDGPKLGMEVKAELRDVRPDETEAVQSPGLCGTREAERPRYGGKTANNYGEFVQSAVPEFDDVKLENEVKAEARDVGCDHAVQSAVPESDGPKLGNEAEAEARDVRRDKTKASQSAGLPGTLEIEHWRNRGIIAGAIGGKPQEHQAVQSAVPDFDGLKLGNEVKAEIHDVRRDRTKVNHSVSLSGTMEVEHQAAGHVAGSQTRPKSPLLLLQIST